MALLLPVPSEISCRGFPRQHSKLQSYRSLQKCTQIRAQISPENSDKMTSRVKSAFEKALEYKKYKEEQKPQNKDKNDASRDAVRGAFERAKEYKQQRDEKNCLKEHNTGCHQGGKTLTEEDETVEMEIVAKDGLTKMESTPSDQELSSIKYDENKVISSIDFVAVQVSEKNPKEGLSVNPNSGVQPTTSGPLTGVEITGFVKNDDENQQQEQAQQRHISFQNQNDGSQSVSSQPKKGTDDAALPQFEEESTYEQKNEKNFAMVDNTVLKEDEKNTTEEGKTVEVEIITRDGIIRRKFIPPAEAFSNIKDYRNKSISSVDFPGLRFSETKPKRGHPAGLNVDIQTPPLGSLPEAEIIVGDVTKFGYEAPARTNGSSDLYKPKVSSWGVFPRPENISQTYGGGRTIRPGEPLESEEEKAAREAQTKKLLEKYKQKTGQNLDPEVKARCEKVSNVLLWALCFSIGLHKQPKTKGAINTLHFTLKECADPSSHLSFSTFKARVLKEGNDLMDGGRLRDALVYYEKIMNDMVFESELHGRAALQWSVCLETLNRSNDARGMYKKLSSHPNSEVMKKAKQLLFAFEAMEKLKISQTYSLDTSGYRKYFEAFTDGYSNHFLEEEEANDQIIGQSLPYIIFLLLPIVLVFTAAAYKQL